MMLLEYLASYNISPPWRILCITEKIIKCQNILLTMLLEYLASYNISSSWWILYITEKIIKSG